MSRMENELAEACKWMRDQINNLTRRNAELEEDLSVARQSLYEVVEQRNIAIADVERLKQGLLDVGDGRVFMTKDYFDKMRAKRDEFKEASTLLGAALDDLKYAREDADRALSVLENVKKEASRISSPDERLRILRLMEGE